MLETAITWLTEVIFQLVAQYAGRATLWLLPVMVMIVGVYIYRYRPKRTGANPQAESEFSAEELSAEIGEGK